MRSGDVLRVRKLRLQQLAELLAMPCIDRHDDIIEQREGKPLTKQALH
jgi:hypothetical protein